MAEEKVIEEKAEVSPVATRQLTEDENTLNMLYVSLQQASVLKGGFTMKDSRSIKNAYVCLAKFLVPQESEQGVQSHLQADEEELNAYSTLLTSCAFQQDRGAFSFDGSDRILTGLEKLEAVLNDNKSNKLRMEELKKKIKGDKNQKK